MVSSFAAATPLTAVLPSRRVWPLHGVAASRQVEQLAVAGAAPHALMQRAGLGLTRLALALAPHAEHIWIAAGPGNNGGDGLVAARLLHQAGKRVQVSLLADPLRLPRDAAIAWQAARNAGVPISASTDCVAPPAGGTALAIDALLGLGAARAPQGPMAESVALLNGLHCPVLAVDLPSGLSGDSGQPLGSISTIVHATHTLALLTLKPGLFTGLGRDAAGQVWFDALDLPWDEALASAWLSGPPLPRQRWHAQHKGSFGDVTVLGGAPGMGGAALLAARAALAAGAGRVMLARLDGDGEADSGQPELMPRNVDQLLRPKHLAAGTLVCGCGGGAAVAAHLMTALAHSTRLVLDADGLNAVAGDANLAAALAARAACGQTTVLTPHPLEAARLLACTTAQVQADRLGSAQALAERYQCVVLLKGSGSVVAAPGRRPAVNPTGNARLACAGTGDVLAGWIGGWWQSQVATTKTGLEAAVEAAKASAWLHGAAADSGLWRPRTAGHLAQAMARVLDQLAGC